MIETIWHRFIPLPPGATVQARSAYDNWMLFGTVGFGVALLVIGLIGWCVLRYRKGPHDDESYPKQFRRNGRLEIIYTIVPLLLVVVLFGYTYAAEQKIEHLTEKPDLVVYVEAFRWSWRFIYPHDHIEITGLPSQPPELVLPLGQTTLFHVNSLDVAHSFWIPAFLFKRDAIPGIHNSFDLTPTVIGTFRGQCGEFCGLHHTDMLFTVRVLSPQAFALWITRHRSAQANLLRRKISFQEIEFFIE